MSKSWKEQLALYEPQAKTALVQPFLKWAGGKRQLWSFIERYILKDFEVYYEPFVGAGAILFAIQPKKAVINDINEELINCYEVIKDLKTDLIEDLKSHKNDSEYFYSIRELDRGTNFSKLNSVQRASRIIYLNKTCFNGLFRVNSNGQFNVPFGKYKRPNIINSEVIKAVSSYLNRSDVKILNLDFAEAVKTAKRNDFIYFDPPYDPLSSTASFTGYSLDGFSKNEQIRLRNVFEDLTIRGCKVMVSNSFTPFIENLYKDYNIIKVPANRNINSNGEERKKIEELIITNYPINNEK